MKALLLIFIAVLISSSAFAAGSEWRGATKFGVPEYLTPAAIEKLPLDAPNVRVQNREKDYWVEATALLDGDAEQIYRTSMDYENYEKFAPYVLSSRIMGEEKNTQVDRELHFWSRMRYTARFFIFKSVVVSMTYLRVQGDHNVVSPGDFGIRWQLEPKNKEWMYPVDTYFTILDGSWYILPVGNHRTFVRYFFKVRVDSSLPKFILDSVLNDSFESGVRELILAIGKRARQ